MTNEIKVTSATKSAISGIWYTGTVNGVEFEALVYDNIDEDYNYNGGKVANIAIGKGTAEYNAFSRGYYDGATPTGELKAKFDAIAAHFNA